MFTGGKLSFLFCLLGFLFQAPAYSNTASPTYVKSLYSLPLALDPIKMNDTASLVVGNLIYDGLLKFSPSLKIEGALAESWSTSSDGKTLTFLLRPNIYFHSGELITAHDAEASLKRALSPDSKVHKLYDSIKEFRVVDKRTLQIVLHNPFPPFLSILAGATAKVLPRSKLADPKFFEKPIGSGAFKYESLDADAKEIILKAHASYYLGRPNLSEMKLKVSTEDEALRLAREGFVHDLSNWPLSENDPIFSDGKRISSPVASTWIIGLNSQIAPFTDLKVRQLFKAQIPSEKFRKEFYPDAIKANGYIPHGLPGSQVKYSFKIDGLNPTKDKIIIAVPQELARAEDMKKMFEVDMKSKGWNIEIKLMPWDKLMEGYANKSLQGFLVSMNMDYPDADFLLKNFESDNPDNFSGIKNVKLDDLIKKSRSTQDRRQRDIFYKEALKYVEDLAVTVNLFHPRSNHWVAKCVENFHPNLLSDVYIDYFKVSLSPSCQQNKLVKK